MEKYDYNYAEYESPFFNDDSTDINITEELYNKWFKDLFDSLDIEYPFKTKNKIILNKFGQETYINEHELLQMKQRLRRAQREKDEIEETSTLSRNR